MNAENADISIRDGHNLCKKSRKCECSVNRTTSFIGSFSLACGSSLKIFETDEPLEMTMEIVLQEPSSNIDLCDLKVKVEVENGDILEFDITNPNLSPTTTESNSISFYSKKTRKVTLECQSNTGVGCRGTWRYSTAIRGSSENCKCECPLNQLIGQSSEYALTCWRSMDIFKSSEPAEMFMDVNLREISGQSCDLKVKVDLANGDVLEFDIPGPLDLATFTDINEISFYSKQVCKISLECQSGTTAGCTGAWFAVLLLRGQEIERA